MGSLAAVVGLGMLGAVGIVIGWQRIIWAVIFWVVIEGAVRKWLFSGLQAEIYLIKDALLLSAYISFLTSRVTPDKPSKAMLVLRMWALIALFYFALQMLNPNSPSIILSLIGLKNYLLYVPLAFLVPYLFTSKDDLEKKLRRYALAMIPFAALGLIQFLFPPDHWLNVYLSHDEENIAHITVFGEGELGMRARTIGTFSYIGGFVTFLTVMLYLGIALVASSKWKIKGNKASICLVVVALGAMFTTGSRTPFYGLMLTAPMMLWIWAVRGLMGSQHLIKGTRHGCDGGVARNVLSAASNRCLRSRADTAGDTLERLFSPISELYDSLRTSPVFGFGIGSAHSSAGTIMGTQDYWWLQGNMFEVETARVLQETGIVGLILVYGCRIWLVATAIGLAMRFRTPLYIALSAVIAGFFLQYLYLFVINNPTAGIYYWFCAGLLFAMYRLESMALAKAQGGFVPSRKSNVVQPVG